MTPAVKYLAVQGQLRLDSTMNRYITVMPDHRMDGIRHNWKVPGQFILPHRCKSREGFSLRQQGYS